jgi:hypothetical protein
VSGLDHPAPADARATTAPELFVSRNAVAAPLTPDRPDRDHAWIDQMQDRFTAVILPNPETHR